MYMLEQLTHVTGIRKLVTEPTKMNDPSQSTLFSWAMNGLVLKFNLRNIGIITNATPQNGRLIQKIHLCL
jgi:hypothetical protein